MSTYSFSGKIVLGKETQPFNQEIEAESMKHAEEKLYATLGSRHSVSRSKITIEDKNEE